jgi:hypothetical protein
MSKPWQMYQQEVADFFRSLGFITEIERHVTGTRAIHEIDIHATRETIGVTVTWIVECKLWNTAIPKEKVLVLSQIAADVGADRAFLLSESGFQSGALRASEKTNVTLTSLQDLREHARAEIHQRELNLLSQKAHALQAQLHDVFILDDNSPGPPAGANRDAVIDLLSRVFEIKAIALPRALADEFPIALSTLGKSFRDSEAFVSGIALELDEIATALSTTKREIAEALTQARSKAAVLFATVNTFLDTCETTLFGSDTDVRQDALQLVPTYMKRVGAEADELRRLLSGRARRELSSVMRALIDGPYVLVTEEQSDKTRWGQRRRDVESALGSLAAIVQGQNGEVSSPEI